MGLRREKDAQEAARRRGLQQRALVAGDRGGRISRPWGGRVFRQPLANGQPRDRLLVVQSRMAAQLPRRLRGRHLVRRLQQIGGAGADARGGEREGGHGPALGAGRATPHQLTTARAPHSVRRAWNGGE